MLCIVSPEMASRVSVCGLSATSTRSYVEVVDYKAWQVLAAGHLGDQAYDLILAFSPSGDFLLVAPPRGAHFEPSELLVFDTRRSDLPVIARLNFIGLPSLTIKDAHWAPDSTKLCVSGDTVRPRVNLDDVIFCSAAYIFDFSTCTLDLL